MFFHAVSENDWTHSHHIWHTWWLCGTIVWDSLWVQKVKGRGHVAQNCPFHSRHFQHSPDDATICCWPCAQIVIRLVLFDTCLTAIFRDKLGKLVPEIQNVSFLDFVAAKDDGGGGDNCHPTSSVKNGLQKNGPAKQKLKLVVFDLLHFTLMFHGDCVLYLECCLFMNMELAWLRKDLKYHTVQVEQ